IDDLVIGFQPAVGNAEHELRAHHALELDPVLKFFHRWHDLAGELDLADTERTAAAFSAGPAEKETHELPKAVEAEAARHYRVAFEVALEKPEVRLHVEFGADIALTVLAARLRNL